MTADDAPTDDWLVRGSGDPREIATYYDAWAARYDTDLDSWSYQAPEAAAEALLGRQPAPASVLDVGCGTGLVGRALRARGYSGRLAGLDISQTSLSRAADTGAYDAVERADLQQRLPVGDAAVEAAICVGVMTYLPDTEAVWREFARVVRPAGHVVLTQREDLWAERACQDVVDRLAAEGVWTPVEVRGPAPYLPDDPGELGQLGCYYVVASIP